MYQDEERSLALANLGNGLKITVNLCEMGSGDLYFGIPFEPEEVALLRRLIRPGDVVVDVGANIGFYSLLFSRLVGEGGRVHAFEPSRDNWDLLLKNIRLNSLTNVISNRAALSDRAGKSTLYVNKESGLNSLGKTHRGEVSHVEEVPCTTLDDYLASEKISKVNLLKIDVEGYDGHVLRGARELLDREKDLAICCELAELNFAPLGFSVDDVIRWMAERGFDAWEIRRSDGSLARLDGRSIDRNDVSFLFAARGGSRAEAIEEAARRNALHG